MNNYGKMLGRSAISIAGFLFLLGAVIFLSGGIGWWQGWLFLAVFTTEMLLTALCTWYTNPEVVIARSKIQKGTKDWDLVLFYLLQALLLAVFPVAGLDHWSAAPLWVIALGYILVTMGMAGANWVMSVNKFAEMSVRIQTERGHQVVDTGPYAVVRHPFYVAALGLFIGMALALGSYWALIPAVAASIVLVVRTVWEDRVLQDELPGYREYAARVRSRLIPGVW